MTDSRYFTVMAVLFTIMTIVSESDILTLLAAFIGAGYLVLSITTGAGFPSDRRRR